MEASFTFGRVRGIPIGVHSTWLIAFALLSYSLAERVLPARYDGWSAGTYWAIGVLATVLLFASVVAHELGHAVVAQARGVGVRSITLFIFGGVALLDQESEEAGDEFAIAVAGPAVSVLVALVAAGLWLATRGVNEQIGALFGYLASANTTLVVFNLIPAFPLDGGRVFRALLWRTTGSVERATRVAASVGMVIGFVFIAVGVFLVFRQPISGIWLVAIGWFLRSAAEQAYRHLAVDRGFAGVRVGALMDPRPVTVGADVTIADLVDGYILGRNVRGLPVVDGNGGALLGIVTLTDVRETPRADWPHLRVRERMTPRAELATVGPATGLDDALRCLSERDIHQVPVIAADGRLVRLLTRNAVIQYLQLRQALPRADQSGTGTRTADVERHPRGG